MLDYNLVGEVTNVLMYSL